MGRDVLSQLLYGTRLGLFWGYLPPLFGIFATNIGAVSGSTRGVADYVFHAMADVVTRLPFTAFWLCCPPPVEFNGFTLAIVYAYWWFAQTIVINPRR